MPKRPKIDKLTGEEKIPEVITERDARGRFLDGHKPSGYSPLSRIGMLKRHHIINNTPLEQVMEVMDAVRKEAARGNSHAAGLWLAYAVGAPEKFIEKDDAQAMDALQERRPIEDMTNEQKLQRLALLEVQLREAEKIEGEHKR